MLKIKVESNEFWDSDKEEFVYIKGGVLQLEHSLLSLSKWESNWGKAFMSDKEKTYDETIDYIRCMTINKNVDPNVYYNLSADDIRKINAYIENPMTATRFLSHDDNRINNETVTSELIYYWMVELGIPFECQKWHLNRLITLIKVINKKRGGGKMSKSDIMRNNKQINEMRKKKYNTKG